MNIINVLQHLSTAEHLLATLLLLLMSRLITMVLFDEFGNFTPDPSAHFRKRQSMTTGYYLCERDNGRGIEASPMRRRGQLLKERMTLILSANWSRIWHQYWLCNLKSTSTFKLQQLINKNTRYFYNLRHSTMIP